MYYFYTWGGAARNTTLTLNGYRVKFLSWGGISGSTWLYHDGAWYYVQKYSCVTNGWYQIDGAENLDADGDTDWYYIDDGEIKYADGGTADLATYDDDGAVYVQRIKIEGKYFAFNEKGQMQDGLQYCQD